MKHTDLNFLFILAIVLGTSCWHQDKTTNGFAPNTNQTMKQTDSNYFHAKHFNQLYKYILEYGEVESVDASSIIGKPMYVEYHTISCKNMILTVDKSNRIYFRENGAEKKKIGNIVKTEDDLVTIESSNEHQKQEITDMYNEMILLISSIFNKQEFKYDTLDSKSNILLNQKKNTIFIYFDTGFQQDDVQLFMNDSLCLEKNITTKRVTGLSFYVELPLIKEEQRIRVIINNTEYGNFIFDKKFCSAHFNFDKKLTITFTNWKYYYD